MAPAKIYDLEERTKNFSVEIIRLCREIPKNRTDDVLVKQLIRSATSVGANYREANETETKKDFCFRARISRKEAKETVYWLNLLVESCPNYIEKITFLEKEAGELVKILASIVNKSS